jgi:murein DD-endopeptidase MepM/ murein hydrolase activator NlpD
MVVSEPGRVVCLIVSAVAVLAATCLAPVDVAAGPAGSGAAPCLRPPVVGEVVDPFRAPACPWCAGNRGIEYRVGAGTPVVNAAAGVVEFAGAVAGTTYVVVRLANGWRLTYGQLTSLRVEQGDRVLAGRVVGEVDGAFFLGLRVGDEYADPAPYLGRLTGRPRLVPLDGTPARSVAAEVRCGAAVVPR